MSWLTLYTVNKYLFVINNNNKINKLFFHKRHTHEQSICPSAKSIVFLKKKKIAKNIVTQLKFSDIFNRDIHKLNLPSLIVVIEILKKKIKEKYEKLQLMVELGVQFREGKY